VANWKRFCGAFSRFLVKYQTLDHLFPYFFLSIVALLHIEVLSSIAQDANIWHAMTTKPSMVNAFAHPVSTRTGYHIPRRAMFLHQSIGPSEQFHSTILPQFPSSSIQLSDAQVPEGVYEPIIPQTETLVGMGLIVILCIAACWTWANQVVPVSRTNLAISKSRGEVKEYLNGLKESEALTDKELQSEFLATNVTGAEQAVPISAPSKDDRSFERWLFTDWLQDNKSARKAGRQKEPALPILKDAKWNSGDNPVLAASALIGLGVLISAVTERVVSII
jgi:hypothetical protein